MNHFSVDGVELSVPYNPDAPLSDLLKFLRETLVSERALIASVKINGIEVTSSNEQELFSTPMRQINSIVVKTSHPREVADETLHHLLEYSTILENLSRTSADLIQDASYHDHMFRLLEGISTFTSALAGVKEILKAKQMQEVQLLETDLLSILKDLLEYQQAGQYTYSAEILREHLPKNLTQWREGALPSLIRLRDC
jgi:hypothetical protein